MNPKPKPRKPKLELREPAKPLSTGSLDPNHPAALIFAEVKKAESERVELSASLANPASQADNSSLANRSTDERQIASLANSSSLAKPATHLAEPRPNLLASLPEARGYLKLHHQLVDHLFTQLPPPEQAVYLQLYRLSWGFGNPTCEISYPGIARRTCMSARAAQDVTNRLITKNLISKIGVIQGKGKEQGIKWRVEVPASLANSASQEESARLAKSAGNINKEIKENNKKGNELSLNSKNCPDCQGSGFYYPEGFEGGVAKCTHQKLKETIPSEDRT